MNEHFDLYQTIGHFHLLLLHLPIGFVVLLGLLEVVAALTRWQHANGAANVILPVSLVAGFITAACGWILAANGDYDAQLLLWHRWGGLGVPVSIGILWWLHYRSRVMAYRSWLIATLVLLAVVSHFGGSLTHGRGFLFASKAPANSKATLETIQSKSAYEAVIHPLFDRTCVSCHGPSKAKADLRMDTFEHLKKGSEKGVVVVPENPAQSPLIERLTLPLDDDDHMPPAGKPQLSAEEIELIRWWIQAGASADKKLADLNPPAEIRRRFGIP